MNTDTGIYAIISPSGKQYIGSAVSFKKRWWLHIKDLRGGTHHSPMLQRAWDKYGEANMVFKVLVLCPITDLLVVEQSKIDAIRPEYNVCQIAGSAQGLKRSALTRDRLSKALIGRPKTEMARMQMSAAWTIDRKNKHAAHISGSGHPMWGKKGNLHHNFGKPLTAETKKKLSENRTNRRTGKDSYQARKIQCVETGEVFHCLTDAIFWCVSLGHTKACRSNLATGCRTGRVRYGYTWRYSD